MPSKIDHQDEVLFNITQIAKELGVVPATLRNWEKQGLFYAKRSVNNYRVYSLDDLELLRRIYKMSVEQQMSGTAIKSILVTGIPQSPYGKNGRSNTKEASNKYTRTLLGDKWRKEREKLGLSLDEVSKAIGISSTRLSKIEMSQINISLELLNKLASFYGESISHFMNQKSEDRKLVPRGNGEPIDIGVSGVKLESLISQKNHILFPMLYTIEPSCEAPETHRHHGEEFIYVLSGKLQVTLNYEEIYELKSGDSIFFKSFDYHHWMNKGPKPVRLIWVHSPLEFGN